MFMLLVEEAYLLLSIANFIIGLLYPVWSTLQTLDSDNPRDDAQWLAYWLCYAMLLIFEYTLDWLLVLFPMYQLVRLVLLLWLTIPYLHGAEYMYESLLAPMYIELQRWLRQAPALEAFIKQVEDLVQDGQLDGAGATPSSPASKAADQFNTALLKRLGG